MSLDPGGRDVTTSFMNAETQGIGLLIEQEREFAVPDHQRDYAWSSDEVAQLLTDIERAIEDGEDDYFLGLIVLEASKPLNILDGQQRLATTTMIYAGIREWLHAAGLESDAHQAQGTYIGLQSFGETDDRPRLTLNINDREFFQDLVVERADDSTIAQHRDQEGRNSSRRKVAEAALICRTRVAEYAEKHGKETSDRAQALYGLAEYMRENVKVVAMQVSSESNAYTIFESLNDRGLDLSVLDLVKNHLFGRAGDKLDAVKHNWAQMTAHLGDRSADDFLKVFWTSRYGRIQRGKLFQEWRKRFDGLSPAKVLKLTAELIISADRFAALDSSEDDVWNQYSPELRTAIADLSLLGNRQMRPIILAAIEQFSATQFEKLVQHLVVATFRYQNVGKLRTGALETSAAKTAKAIADKKATTASAAWKELKSIVPNDEDFKLAFARYSESTAKVAKYVLSALELEARRRDTGSFAELEPSPQLTLEHILPQSPGDPWKAVLEPDPELIDYTERLGNLTLLTKGSNKSAGNQSYADKASAIYQKSSLLITSGIPTHYSNWERDSIRSRQDWLASLAPSIWSLP
jgi:Protein of unknown function DUF262/Protein of unknown function (DUF1524)